MGGPKGQKHNPYIEGKYGHLNPNDIVFTPDWLAKQIVDMFDIEGTIVEPCKGEGAFLKYLPPDTEWCEIVDGKNYYDYDKKVDWIVTNPPYSDYNRFLDHSFYHCYSFYYCSLSFFNFKLTILKLNKSFTSIVC